MGRGVLLCRKLGRITRPVGRNLTFSEREPTSSFGDSREPGVRSG